MKQKLINAFFGCGFLFLIVIPGITEGRISGGPLGGNILFAENPIEFSFWFIVSVGFVIITFMSLFREDSDDDESK